MGKLAERLGDARRCGVYRVEATDALEEAVALNGFTLIRMDLRGATPAGLRRIAGLGDGVDGHVLLFSGIDSLTGGRSEGLAEFLSALRAVAARSESVGLRFFAAFLDPQARLSLPPLYNRRRLQADPGSMNLAPA